MSEGTRRLAAIMFTDIVGYTALSQRNETLALQLVDRHRSLMRPVFARHKGHEVKTMGDAFLVQFESALEAVECAVEMQEVIHNQTDTAPEKLQMKVGIHVGDVVQSDTDVHGDAVNIASRIEPLARGGEICISQQVYDQVRNKVPFKLVKLEAHDLKNVAVSIDVYRVELPWEEDKVVPTTEFDKNRIAVLPFVNMSPDPNDEYFSDGMTEELIDRLAQVKQLKVIARTSIMAYKKKEKKASEIARELEVGTLVEGSVRKAGNKIRVTVQLIVAGTEEHLWSSHYDATLEDVFAVQGEIAEKVAGQLRIQLLSSEKTTIEKKATDNTEAYTCFLKGRELLNEGSEPSLRQSLALFDRAIELDPSFARAYEGQAECFVTLANDGYEPYEETNIKAEYSVKKALELDPELAEAHATLAYVYFSGDRVGSCEVEAKRALELNPSISDAYRELAFIALLRGNADQGIMHLETAWRLDPLRSFYIERLGQLYFYTGRENEALRFWEKTAQLAPAANYRSMTEYYLSRQDYNKAKDFFALAKELEPTHHWVTWMQAFMAAKMGDREGALQTIRVIDENLTGVDPLNHIAFIHYALGDLDSYFTYLNKAADQHSLRFIYVMYSPLFAKGREDARYRVVLSKMKGF